MPEIVEGYKKGDSTAYLQRRGDKFIVIVTSDPQRRQSTLWYATGARTMKHARSRFDEFIGIWFSNDILPQRRWEKIREYGFQRLEYWEVAPYTGELDCTWRQKHDAGNSPYRDTSVWQADIDYGTQKTAHLLVKKKERWKKFYWQMWLGMRKMDDGAATSLTDAQQAAEDRLIKYLQKFREKTGGR